MCDFVGLYGFGLYVEKERVENTSSGKKKGGGPVTAVTISTGTTTQNETWNSACVKSTRLTPNACSCLSSLAPPIAVSSAVSKKTATKTKSPNASEENKTDERDS